MKCTLAETCMLFQHMSIVDTYRNLYIRIYMLFCFFGELVNDALQNTLYTDMFGTTFT